MSTMDPARKSLNMKRRMNRNHYLAACICGRPFKNTLRQNPGKNIGTNQQKKEKGQ